MDTVTALTTLGIIGIVLFVVIGVFIAIALASYIMHAVALRRISEKAGRKNGWLAWIPVATDLLQAYVMCDVAGDKPFRLFNGKIKFEKRITSFIVFAVIAVVVGGASSAGNFSLNIGTDVSTEFLSPDIAIGLLILILILALIGTLISVVVAFILASFEYVYLRDILEFYYPGRKSNVKTAVLVTVGSYLFSYLVRAIYLIVLSKKEPEREPESTPPAIQADTSEQAGE